MGRVCAEQSVTFRKALLQWQYSDAHPGGDGSGHGQHVRVEKMSNITA